MDDVRVQPTTWRGVAAWLISGPRLEAVITRVGGHLACLRHPGAQLNPLWQPQWPACAPGDARPGGYYGGIEASLLATIVGHSLSMDRFGPPRPGESRPVHGEVNTLSWTLTQCDPQLVECTVQLPEARLQIRKRLAFDGEALLLSHGVYHNGPGEREIEWCEHVSLGDPFLDGAQINAGIDRVYNWPGASEPGSRFPRIGGCAEVPRAAALAMPAVADPACGDVLTAPVVEGWWAVENAKLGHRLTYRWQPQHFPWLTLWTQHRSRTGTPWLARERVRGMEITTKPYPDGTCPAERHPRWKDIPTVCRVAAGRWREHPLRIEWTASG